LLWGEEYHHAWSELLGTVQTGTIAFDRAYGASLYQYLHDNPETARTYNDAMTGLAELLYPAVVATYDFSNSKQLVDIGGGCGTLLLPYLLQTPTLKESYSTNRQS
jgi:hypothetical protein